MSLDQPFSPTEDLRRQLLRERLVTNLLIDTLIGRQPIRRVLLPRVGVPLLAPTSPPSHRLDYRCIHRAVNPRGTLPSAEDGARDPADQIQLGPLLIRGELVALHRRGEAALRTEREPPQRDDARSLGDAPLERIFVFQPGALGRDQPQ